jgi:small GTP-binding protein
LAEEPHDYIFKIIAVGDAGVGKTSLTIRFANDKFQEDYKMTLGMNLVSKTVNLQNYTISLAIWDTGGQDSFAPLLPMYYRGALGALVVYDLTKEKTFKSVDKWLNDIKRYCDEIPIVLIGNKKDLEDTMISREEGEQLAEQLRGKWGKTIHFREASAKDDLEVDGSFQALAESILEIVEEEEMEDEEED